MWAPRRCRGSPPSPSSTSWREPAAYGALKRDLATRFGEDIERYTRAKTALIQEIMDREADEVGRARRDVWED